MRPSTAHAATTPAAHFTRIILWPQKAQKTQKCSFDHLSFVPQTIQPLLWYSMYVAVACAASRPKYLSTTRSARSIPEDSPPDVEIVSSSSTKRSPRLTLTSGNDCANRS